MHCYYVTSLEFSILKIYTMAARKFCRSSPLKISSANVKHVNWQLHVLLLEFIKNIFNASSVLLRTKWLWIQVPLQSLICLCKYYSYQTKKYHQNVLLETLLTCYMAQCLFFRISPLFFQIKESYKKAMCLSETKIRIKKNSVKD